MKDGIYFISVFLEGLASFLSPCVLPLIPAYMTYLTGQSAEAMSRDERARKSLIINSLAFVAGFTIVFVLLGAAATKLGSYLLRHQHSIRRISGILIILFGLFHAGWIPIRFLNYERRLQLRPERKGFLSSLLIGMGFSMGWTPCIGPILTSVLILAANAQTVSRGMLLLAVYAMGLGLPFLALSIGIRYLWKYLKIINRYMGLIKKVSGIILIIIGLMIYFNLFAILAYY
ncbi:MAG: cytochrome c biogenesis CcdA family protein [Caldicoprobacterales bacterium]|nr:cytochrome c biogenesis protein CcdA [Clostridiales bacterium]